MRQVPELEGRDKELIGAVFARMKNIYGHLFSSNFKSENQLRLAQAEWLAAFKRKRFTPKQINHALDWCVDNEPDLPNLPKFLQIVKGFQQNERARQATSRYLAELPASQEERERAEAVQKAERDRLRKTGKVEISKLRELF